VGGGTWISAGEQEPPGRQGSAPMDEILGHVADAVDFLNRWLRRHVRGFTGFSEDERRGYSAQLAYLIGTGQCPCGGANCRTRHNRAGFGATGVTGLRQFVWSAVLGPRANTKRPEANSLAQGMLYRLVLRRSYPLRIVEVELKHCHQCQRRYELLNCEQPGCGTPFDPAQTRAVRQARLILRDQYVRVRRWGCAGNVPAPTPAPGTPDGRQRRRGPRPDHYFQQDRCRESLDEPKSPRPFRVHHGEPEDGCPLRSCPRHGQRHPERGTGLWVRKELAEQPGSHLPVGWGVIRRWARRQLAGMSRQPKRRLRAAIRAEEDGPAGRLDVLEIGRRLLSRVYPGVWSDEQRRQAVEEVRESLWNYGLDLSGSDDHGDPAEDD
jgi:hypothetical protein